MAGFTAVAAGVGLAVSAATTAASFAQAADQASKKQKAEEKAAAAMAEARKRLDVNVYENIAIQQDAFKEARRDSLVQGKMGTDVLTEGDPRALAAGVGRIQLAQQKLQTETALEQQKQKQELDELVATEEGDLLDKGYNLDLGIVEGAQLAARDAEKAEAKAIKQGMAGIGEMTDDFAKMAKLYDDSDLTPEELEEKTTMKEQNKFNKLQTRLGQTEDEKRQERIRRRLDRINAGREGRGVNPFDIYR